MIPHWKTNHLYVSALLKERHVEIYQKLKQYVTEAGHRFSLLKKTADVWAVDYMPVQVAEGELLQFRYDPDYLHLPGYRETRTDPKAVRGTPDISLRHSNLILDGGNVVCGEDCVVLTAKVFADNAGMSEQEVVAELERLFQARIAIIPWDPLDITGHSDGMVRFLNNDTVLINAYPKEERALADALTTSLLQAGLKWKEFPYAPQANPRTSYSAAGLYLNYLQMEGLIVIPSFGFPEDDKALEGAKELFPFPRYRVETISCKTLSDKGGVLNCISWNIRD